MGHLYNVEYGICRYGDVLPFHLAAVCTEAKNMSDAATAAKLFITSRDPVYLAQPYVAICLVDVTRVRPRPYKRPLLVLIGGTEEAYGGDQTPQQRFPPNTCVIRMVASGVLEVAYVRYWHPDRLRWSGYRWHRPHRCWLPVTSASAEEIIGLPAQVAQGQLAQTARDAMLNPPK